MSYATYLQREQDVLDMYTKERMSNTCNWLFAHQDYNAWANAVGPPFLWLHGQPGTGKSTLCSAMIADLRRCEQYPDVTISCFIEEGLGQLDCAQYILKAFVYQLRGCRNPIVSDVLLRSTLKEIERLEVPVSLEAFQRCLRTMLAGVSDQARVVLIFDGLDSNDWIRTVIMNEIIWANLPRQRSNVFRCTISTQATFDAALRNYVAEINLDVEPGLQRDLQEFASVRLAHTSWASYHESLSVTSLVERLCSRANGIFLWVALAMEKIDRMKSVVDLPNQIELIPATVDGIYHQNLQAVPSQSLEIARSVFYWLMAANRPLYFSELLEALSIKLDSPRKYVREASPRAKLTAQPPEEEICSICGWLILITGDGVVKFRHQSVRTHLISKKNSRLSGYLLLEAHEFLARTCLRLLETGDRKSTSWLCTNISDSQDTSRGLASNLTNYAIANWSVHYRHAETSSMILAGTLQRCLVRTLEYACESLPVSLSRRSIQISNATLRFSARYGFFTLTKLCLEAGAPPTPNRCCFCESPLAIAAAGGHKDVAALLLQKGASIISQIRGSSEDVLHLAVAQGSLPMVELLLTYGARVDVVDFGSERTLLHVAAASGHLDVVKLLMDYDVDVNAVIPTSQETPLHLAAMHGHLEVVEYLVFGGDPSAKEIELYNAIVQQPYYQSLIENLLAADAHTENIWGLDEDYPAQSHFKKLLSYSSKYADINMRTCEGWTALYLAAARGHKAIVRFLLERRAIVQTDGEDKSPVLQVAAENGHGEVVKLLLEAGADVDAGAEQIGRILKNASKFGQHEIVNMIIWQRFSIGVTDQGCQRPVLRLAIKGKQDVIQEAMHRKRLRRSARATRSRSTLSNYDAQTYFLPGNSRM